jgi:hypothetical protein
MSCDSRRTSSFRTSERMRRMISPARNACVEICSSAPEISGMSGAGTRSRRAQACA